VRACVDDAPCVALEAAQMGAFEAERKDKTVRIIFQEQKWLPKVEGPFADMFDAQKPLSSKNSSTASSRPDPAKPR